MEENAAPEQLISQMKTFDPARLRQLQSSEDRRHGDSGENKCSVKGAECAESCVLSWRETNLRVCVCVWEERGDFDGGCCTVFAKWGM